MKALWPGLATACAVLLADAAWAARPFVTDDAGVLERRSCEAEPVLGHERASGEGTTIVSGQVACGVGYQTQFSLGVARSIQSGRDTTALGAAGKSLLRDGGDSAVSLAVSYGTDLEHHAVGDARFQALGISALASLPLSARISMHGNVGWRHTRSEHTNSTTWGLAVEWKALKSIDTGLELYGDDRGSAWLAAVMRWTFSERWSANASIAAQPDGERARFFTVAGKLVF